MARKNDQTKRDCLNRLVASPRLKRAAREAGIDASTIFKWIRESVNDPERHMLEWLGHRQPFHMHVNAARKLNTVAIDHAARDLALNGHITPKFHDGRPVWKVDARVAADALALPKDDWSLCYGDRPRSDVYLRDPETGSLVQEVDVSPPNPALLVKLLTSLAPEVYGERSTVEHHHTGRVWIEGGDRQTPPLLPPPTDFNADFGLTSRPEETARPTNTLAIPRPCATSGEFDQRFRKKLLRDVVLFYDTEGKLLAPLQDDVIVAGTDQHRAFQDAGIEVTVVHPTTLLDEGFENDFLRELAPNYKRKLKPEKKVEEVIEAEVVEVVQKPVEQPGKASARYDAENIGRGTPRPGGRRVEL